MIALGGVVVDDIQDDLDAGVVQILDHLLEFADRVARPAGVAGVARLGRKESQRVVAPVIAQPLVEQMTVVDEVMNGHELDAR